jgi:hypothetical protein
MDLAARLGRLQLLVVTGKGGVGKTAVAASLGRLLAAAGKRTLVLEVDPRENVHQMLGVSPSGGAIVAAGPRLWVQNLKPGQVLDDIVRERLKVEMLARRVLASPIYEQFSASAPGLKELAILGHALRLLRRTGSPDAPALDTVVLDAPATGHGVRLLAAPRLVSEVVRNGPFAALAGELAGFIADPERCGIVVEEALELREALASQLARQPELLVVNGLFPPLPGVLQRSEIFDPLTPLDALDPRQPRQLRQPRRPQGAPGAPAGEGRFAGRQAAGALPVPEVLGEAALLTFWRHRRFLNEHQLECLARWWEGPRVELPQLALERGPELTTALQQLLAAGLAAAGAGAGPPLRPPPGGSA